MKNLERVLKNLNLDREMSIQYIKVACELIQSGDLSIGSWEKDDDNSLPPASNTCGPAVGVAYAIWEDLKERG